MNATGQLLQITEIIRSGSHEIELSANEINSAIQNIQSASMNSTNHITAISDKTGDINGMLLKLNENLIFAQKNIRDIETAENVLEPTEKINVTIPILCLQHILWLLKTRSVLYCRRNLATRDVGDHTKCDLGKWILSDAAAGLKADPMFMELVRNHEKLHRFVREIVLNTEHKTVVQLESQFTELIGLSEIIVEGLIKLKHSEI